MITPVRCGQNDAISHGDVLPRRTTKGASAIGMQLNGSRDERRRSLKPRTVTPRRASAIDPGATSRVRKVQKCGGTRYWALPRDPLRMRSDEAGSLETMATSRIALAVSEVVTDNPVFRRLSERTPYINR